jgi:uncharacterized protein with HEPN domain
MRNNKDRELLLSILEAKEFIDVHVAGPCGHFTRERAIIFELVTIGEAATHLSKELKETYPHVAWRLISDARNRMVHDYDNISSKIVWDIVNIHLPALMTEVQSILNQRGGTP